MLVDLEGIAVLSCVNASSGPVSRAFLDIPAKTFSYSCSGCSTASVAHLSFQHADTVSSSVE